MPYFNLLPCPNSQIRILRTSEVFDFGHDAFCKFAFIFSLPIPYVLPWETKSEDEQSLWLRRRFAYPEATALVFSGFELLQNCGFEPELVIIISPWMFLKINGAISSVWLLAICQSSFGQIDGRFSWGGEG